jgi:hypothetical protein
MGYKYLNTCYPELFDSAVGYTIQNNAIRNRESHVTSTLTNVISRKTSTTSLYLKFTVATNLSSTTNREICYIRTSDTNKTLVIKENSTQIIVTDEKTTFSETVTVPSKSTTFPSANHQRDLFIHFDTVQNVADIYADGILYGSVTCGNSGETIKEVLLGALNGGAWTQYYVYINNVIISDTEFSPLESVTEITPTLTSNDWTITDGVASTDTLGDSMTITATPSSIDETRKTVTGYTIPLLNCIPTTTINSLNITQGTVTKNVKLPLDASTESDSFTVSQLADISATVIASSTL